MPAALLLVGLGAVAFGTLALAALLRRRGASPWWALLFPAYPGIFLAVGHDLAEPLAYALVAGGLYALDRTGVARPLPAALLFGLAGATRETTLVFPAVLAGVWPRTEVVRRNLVEHAAHRTRVAACRREHARLRTAT